MGMGPADSSCPSCHAQCARSRQEEALRAKDREEPGEKSNALDEGLHGGLQSEGQIFWTARSTAHAWDVPGSSPTHLPCRNFRPSTSPCPGRGGRAKGGPAAPSRGRFACHCSADRPVPLRPCPWRHPARSPRGHLPIPGTMTPASSSCPLGGAPGVCLRALDGGASGLEHGHGPCHGLGQRAFVRPCRGQERAFEKGAHRSSLPAQGGPERSHRGGGRHRRGPGPARCYAGGLSEVSAATLPRARAVCQVTAVQKRVLPPVPGAGKGASPRPGGA